MAHIIEPAAAMRTGGPGLSYQLGSKIYGQPLLMLPMAAQRLDQAIQARAFDQVGAQVQVGPQVSRFVGTPAGRAEYRVTDDGIAIVPVAGMLFDRGEWLGTIGGFATTYEGLAEQIRRLIKDQTIREVILDIDSPGGMAAGLFDLVGDSFARLRKAKRVTAIAQNDACSGAYAIAAACHEIYVTQLGRAGSIGVISMHQSYARQLDSSGIDTTIVYAGDHKPNGNPYQPLSHLARGEMTANVDEIQALFVRHVARSRSIGEDAVRALQARVLNGQAAVTAGLADGVASFDEVLAKVRARLKPRQPASASTATNPATGPTGDPMPHPELSAEARADMQAIIAAAMQQIRAENDARAAGAEPKPTAAAAQPAPAVVAPAVTTPVVQPAAATAVPAGDGRARIKAILSAEAAKKRPTLAAYLALETDMDAEQAQRVLGASPEEGATAATPHPLMAAMKQPGTSANVKPDAPKVDSSTLPPLAEKAKNFGVVPSKVFGR
jgi:signal peptide peptidase SppA